MEIEQLPLDLSTLSVAVSRDHARTSASPATVLVLQAKGQDSGANTTDSFANFDPVTSSWRTSQRCLVEGLAKYSETWPRSGMTRNGTAYRLPTWAPLTDATDCGLLPTPTGPAGSNTHLRAQGMTFLDRYVLWPTPTRDGNYNRKGASATSGDGLATAVGGSLNPTWVEWLMGFPLGWTALKHWATPSSRKSQK